MIHDSTKPKLFFQNFAIFCTNNNNLALNRKSQEIKQSFILHANFMPTSRITLAYYLHNAIAVPMPWPRICKKNAILMPIGTLCIYSLCIFILALQLQLMQITCQFLPPKQGITNSPVITHSCMIREPNNAPKLSLSNVYTWHFDTISARLMPRISY